MLKISKILILAAFSISLNAIAIAPPISELAGKAVSRNDLGQCTEELFYVSLNQKITVPITKIHGMEIAADAQDPAKWLLKLDGLTFDVTKAQLTSTQDPTTFEFTIITENADPITKVADPTKTVIDYIKVIHGTEAEFYPYTTSDEVFTYVRIPYWTDDELLAKKAANPRFDALKEFEEKSPIRKIFYNELKYSADKYVTKVIRSREAWDEKAKHRTFLWSECLYDSI